MNPDTDISIVVAILAKDKSHCLPLYLRCIQSQTFPSDKIHLYIRTNNNNDNTTDILLDWITNNESKYKSVYFNSEDVDTPVQNYGHHEWNLDRFRVLGTIRNESIKYAIGLKAHYFTADCDNFIAPHTIESLLNTDKPVVGPMLRQATHADSYITPYSNYHNICSVNGYWQRNSDYFYILNKNKVGVLPVDVVHCTYFIKYNVLDHINYLDNTARHEYVIFSHNLRKAGVQQYLDNSKDYGLLTFAVNKQQYDDQPLIKKFIEEHLTPII